MWKVVGSIVMSTVFPVLVLASDGLTVATVKLNLTPTHSISPLIYGVAFPEGKHYLQHHGMTIARWGGNATSLYNPAGFTNAGNDWYFENRPEPLAQQWIHRIKQQQAQALFTIPALDYVAKDGSSYSYSVTSYGQQQQTDSWKPDAGNGTLSSGTKITWNNPLDAAQPWSVEQAQQWLAQLRPKPNIVTIDNEMDIADSTHRNVHPHPTGYDELLQRCASYLAMVKNTVPTVKTGCPDSTGWWFYWNSAVGATDKAAHDNVDLLPWFLQTMAQQDTQAGQRTLDYLTIHFYPAEAYNNNTDTATQALRLRSTRSLWDASYTDESWIGTDQWATQTQFNRNYVQLIPRFKQLIASDYPDTKLGLTEWSWGAEQDISGGLAVADVLGIFGRYQLDLATYWTAPPARSPAALAFQLYRIPHHKFGDQSLPIEGTQPDYFGAYAAKNKAGNISLILINKQPNTSLDLTITDLPLGRVRAWYFDVQHSTALTKVKSTQLQDTTITIPAYTAMFIEIRT